MAATVPTIEPVEFQAGNTLQFDKSLSDYPASEYTLTYSIRGRGALSSIDLTATADGDDYSISVDATTTADWIAGEYTMVGYVASGSDRFEVYRGSLTITPDIQAATAFDGRTFYERCRDKLKLMIEGSDTEGVGGVIRDIVRYGYNGSNAESVSMKDAFDALSWLESRILQEKNKGRQQRILTRFRQAR